MVISFLDISRSRYAIGGGENETQPYQIRIHADSDYFERMLKTTRVYAEHEWKTKAGKEIANADLWKEIYIFKKTNHVTVDSDLLEHYACKEELEEDLWKFTN